MGVLSGLFERYEFQAHFFGSLVKVLLAGLEKRVILMVGRDLM